MPEQKHLLLPQDLGAAHDYQPIGKPIEREDPPPIANRRTHSRDLLAAIATSRQSPALQQQTATVGDEEAGVLLRFDARTADGLNLAFFNQRHGIELLSSSGNKTQQRARAFAPIGSLTRIENALQKYATSSPRDERQPRYAAFIESVARIAQSNVRELWNAPPDHKFPGAEDDFVWEVWARPKVADLLAKNAKKFGVQISGDPLDFPLAKVFRIGGRWRNLESLLSAVPAAMELRPASVQMKHIATMRPVDEAAIVNAVAGRLVPAPANAPRTAILDTGVLRAHRLLAGSLPAARVGAGLPAWPLNDPGGHGTEMAGIALLGDLLPRINDRDQIQLTTALESFVVIPHGHAPLPPHDAVMRAVRHLERTPHPRVYSMSWRVPDDRTDGHPTSFSGLIDRLAFGRDGTKRLFCVPAGNMDDLPYLVAGYPDANDGWGIETPGQALNALTVGAYTDFHERDEIRGVAPRGDLCPSSRTASSWRHRLAAKPDIVLEGGNHQATRNGEMQPHGSLSVLTTGNQVTALAPTVATSAATAAAAGLATRLMAEYPEFWPETIRGLIVHSARWTPAMLRRKRPGSAKRTWVELVHRFGFGVPDENRAFRTASDHLTMVVQDEVDAFKLQNNKLSLSEMKYYQLPWPREALEAIGDAEVELHVTLSYFAEPNPSAVTRGQPRDYTSHALHFDVKDPDDNDDLAIARVNQKYRKAHFNRMPKRLADGGWTLGPDARRRGTVQRDIWKGKASQLAFRSGISVTPERGWWADLTQAGIEDTTVRYSLILSIQSSEVEADLLTEVMTEIQNLIVNPLD